MTANIKSNGLFFKKLINNKKTLIEKDFLNYFCLDKTPLVLALRYA